MGLCPEASNLGDHVDVFASTSGGGSSETNEDVDRSDVSEPLLPQPAPQPTPRPTPVTDNCTPLNNCGERMERLPPDLTLEDLASFRPQSATLAGEPEGVAIAGLPANLTAPASVHQQSGTVLDWPVTVRFTPVAFVFDYGDGTRATTTTGGDSWVALRLAQFTPTATSHVFRERGVYDVTAAVRYSAEVDFGTGVWRAVPGTLQLPTNDYPVTVLEAHTALVAHTCIEDPRGPGC